MISVSEGVRHDLTPTGRLRTTINLGNAVLARKDAATGELGGISVGTRAGAPPGCGSGAVFLRYCGKGFCGAEIRHLRCRFPRH
jgi:polar amino acid transport system substrate-binding protein